MPITEEPLKEKVPFDVYAMMLILAFLSTAGSIAFLNDHLQKHWYAGELPGTVDHPEHITTLNTMLEDREKWYQYITSEEVKDISTEIEVTPTDLEDYKRATALEPDGEAQESPTDYKPYPAYIHPITNPVSTEPGHDNTEGVPEDVLKEMFEKYQDTTSSPGLSGGKKEGEGDAGGDAGAGGEGAGDGAGTDTAPKTEEGAAEKAE